MRCPPILLRKNSNKRAYRQHLYIFLTMRNILTMKTLGTVTFKKFPFASCRLKENEMDNLR